MKVRITVRPTGYVGLEGQPLTAWPPVGAVVDFPDDIAEDLIKGGNAEKVSRLSGREWLWPWRRPREESVEPPPHVKVRMTGRPTGYVSIDGGPLTAWPQIGTVVDMPAAIAESLMTGGYAEDAPVDNENISVKMKHLPKPGTTVDIPETIARDFIAAGFAEPAPAAAPLDWTQVR